MKLFPAVVLLLLQLPVSVAVAQKIEVERPVSRSELPDSISHFLNRHFPDRQRVDYYLERNESGLFFEVKFCHYRRRYSVKFSEEGRHVDTERRLARRRLPKAVTEAVDRQLSQRLRRYRIVKIQEQLVNGRVQGYEIELRGKSEDHLGLFEAHFDVSGRFLGIRTVEEPPNDFLFF